MPEFPSLVITALSLPTVCPPKHFQPFHPDVYELNWNFWVVYQLIYSFKIVKETDAGHL